MVDIPEQAVEAAIAVIRAHDNEAWGEDCGDEPYVDLVNRMLTAAAPYMSASTREQALEEAAGLCDRGGAWDIADAIRALKSQQNTETSAIEKKKFYHNEWPHDALMAARRDGFIDHNGGEAWRYQFTHKDEKGKYDLLYRDTSNSSIQAALPPVQTGGGK